MRIAVTAVVLLAFAGCSSTPLLTPRQYLDETTAATVTVAAEPWVFTPETGSTGTIAIDRRARDFLTLYAIDVNRQGDHKQYIAVLHAVPPIDWNVDAAPTLQLRFAGEEMRLDAATSDARRLGIAQPIAPSYSLASKWWYFPIDKASLKRLAATRELAASVSIEGKTPLGYALWRDASAQVGELTAVLP
jgi:hypothetical protein